MSSNVFERYLLLERSGNGKTNTSVFEMRLNGRKIHIRHGNKGQKLQKNILKKKSISEAIALFSDKRKQKITNGYRIIKEEDKNNLNKNINNNKSNNVLPLSGRSIINNNNNNKNNNNNIKNKSFSFSFGQKQQQNNKKLAKNNNNKKLEQIRQQLKELNITNSINSNSNDNQSTTSQTSQRSGRLKHGKPGHQNRPRKNKVNNQHKLKHLKNGQKKKFNNNKRKNKQNKNQNKNKKNNKQNNNKNNKKNQKKNNPNKNQQKSVSSSVDTHDSHQENNSQYSNGYNSNKIKQINGYHDTGTASGSGSDTNTPTPTPTPIPDINDDDDIELNSPTSSSIGDHINNQKQLKYNNKSPNASADDNDNNNDADIDESETEQEEEEDDGSDGSRTGSSTGSGSDSQSGSGSGSGSASVQSGRSSDDEYEMDYEKMSHVMHHALNQNISDVFDKLEWKPIKLWIRYNEYNDINGEYAFAPQIKRIAGSCHELLVVYLRSTSFSSEKGIIHKRLLKLARDPEEDNKHHFETERHVSQYLSSIATFVNNSFNSRNDVCIWPVETILFEYNNKLKWATIQPPFLPDSQTNNVFVKIEPNSGKPCVNDPIVGRYQHLFASITRGLDLIRDWQGYGVSQDIFLNVCSNYGVNNEVLKQIKIRKNKLIRKQTQVLVVIDPVLTTYNAHYFTNNPTDFGIKAIDEWKLNHDCVRCRCKYFNLLSVMSNDNNDGMLFGIADPDQSFFNNNKLSKDMQNKIKKLRLKLGIWCGDDMYDDDNNNNDNDCKDDNNNNVIINGDNSTIN